jgi:hypothetical protein
MHDPNTNPTIERVRSFTVIHATALREWVNDNPNPSRRDELMEIVSECERQYPILALFRTMEPMLAEFSEAFDAYCAASTESITNN